MKTSGLLFSLGLTAISAVFAGQSAGEEVERFSINVNSSDPAQLAQLANCGIDAAALAKKNGSAPAYVTREAFANAATDSPACRTLTFRLSDNDADFQLPARATRPSAGGDVAASINVNSSSVRILQPLAKCGIDVPELARKNAGAGAYRTRQDFAASVPNAPAACLSMRFKLSDNDADFQLPPKTAKPVSPRPVHKTEAP